MSLVASELGEALMELFPLEATLQGESTMATALPVMDNLESRWILFRGELLLEVLNHPQEGASFPDLRKRKLTIKENCHKQA